MSKYSWTAMSGEMVLADLDEVTRMFMLEELDLDLTLGRLYVSPRLSPVGRHGYPDILREAIHTGTPSSFAEALRQSGVLNATELRRGRAVRVPSNAAEMLAEGELNRFYVRGVCRRAIEEELAVEVCRAKQVRDPRPESQALIGARPNPEALLDDLRNNVGVETALGVPAGPNSGLSVRIVRSR